MSRSLNVNVTSRDSFQDLNLTITVRILPFRLPFTLNPPLLIPPTVFIFLVNDLYPTGSTV